MNKPVHLLSLSLDENLLGQNDTDVLNRQREYAKHFAHTTIIVMNSHAKLKMRNEDRLTIIPVNAWSKLDLLSRTYFIASRVFHSRPYQLITAQDPIGPGRVGLWLKKRFKVPLNIQIHTDYFGACYKNQFFLNRLYLKFIRKVLINADSIRVVSKNLIPRTSHLAPRTFVAPIRVNLDQFYKPAHYRPKISKFISVCRLAPEKNLDLLIEAFCQAAKDHPEISLTIVGDGPERARLEKLCVMQNAKSVNFTNYESRITNTISLTGHKSSSEVAKLLHQHDVFVLSSLYEGWGMAYVEAFAAGLPIITTPVSSVGELLQPDTNCLIANNTSDFVLRTSYLINHPEEAYRLARNGQVWVKQNLDSKVLTKAWIDGLYNTIVQ